MKNILRLVPFLICASFLSGCGGAGTLLGIGSPFEGSWSGTWDGSAADGPVTFSVTILGELNGTMHSDTSGEDGPLTGGVLDDGTATLTVSFPSESPTVGTGTLILDIGGTNLTGTLDFDGDPIDFVLTRD